MAAAARRVAADRGSTSPAPGRRSVGAVTRRRRLTPRRAAPAAATVAVPPTPIRSARARRASRAASRRAQSWNVGQTGKALERQYASWWASARGAGRVSA